VIKLQEQNISNSDARNLLDSIEKIRSELDNMKVKLSKIVGEEALLIPPDWERKRLKVWARIHEKGDIVTPSEWEKIYTSVGYDPRGTGGFFTGDSSLVKIGEDKVALSKWAVEEVEKYEEWLKKELKKK
jgi:hypothetical protein